MSACERLPEVEAARDRGLPQRERASLDRHLASCLDCAHEARELDQLGRALQTLPVAALSEMVLRRRRRDLLARARAPEPEQVRAAPRRALLGPVATLALSVAVAAVVHYPLSAPPAPPAPAAQAPAPPPSLTIAAGRGAVYTRSVEFGAEVVQLEAGALVLHVQATPGHAPVLVRTPDGVIEDEGTIFSVQVAERETRLVEVSDGSVSVRIAGFPARTLRAGERYEPYANASPTPAAVPEARPRRALSAAARRPQPGELGKRGRARESAAGQQFNEAVSELRLGRPERAARLFAEFGDAQPEDARAEDAAFLRVVALTRAAALVQARAAAHLYLARFPRGLRAREAEQLLAEP